MRTLSRLLPPSSFSPSGKADCLNHVLLTSAMHPTLAFLPQQSYKINSYEGCDNAGGACYNTVEQLQHGKNISRYNKNRPVPIIEAGITPGAEPPTPTTISFGTGRGRSPSEYVHVLNSYCYINCVRILECGRVKRWTKDAAT